MEVSYDKKIYSHCKKYQLETKLFVKKKQYKHWIDGLVLIRNSLESRYYHGQYKFLSVILRRINPIFIWLYIG